MERSWLCNVDTKIMHHKRDAQYIMLFRVGLNVDCWFLLLGDRTVTSYEVVDSTYIGNGRFVKATITVPV